MQVHLKGRLVPVKEAVVSVFDHGFLYGDGVYETMRVYEGVTFMLDEHLRRLYRSASMIGLTIPLEMDSLKTSIYDTLIANSLKNAFVRLTVSRGHGPIGLDPDLCPEPTIVIIAQELKDYPKSFYEKGISLVIPETKRNLMEALNPRIKSLNFLNNILAKIETKKRGAYEAVMLNVYGKLTEGTISNVFFYKDGILCTPSLECGILDGITRGVVIDLALRDGLGVKEGEFTKEDLYPAAEVFITSTTLELMPVSKVDDQKYAVGNITKLLHKAYREEVNVYVANVKAEGPSLWGYE
ncbi:MAG: aminotransferase class IV [Thermodesulfovibrionales bacterium]|nr:aminotransferase class IV [Thermodesulfovibrionales bacterium]